MLEDQLDSALGLLVLVRFGSSSALVLKRCVETVPSVSLEGTVDVEVHSSSGWSFEHESLCSDNLTLL